MNWVFKHLSRYIWWIYFICLVNYSILVCKPRLRFYWCPIMRLFLPLFTQSYCRRNWNSNFILACNARCCLHRLTGIYSQSYHCSLPKMLLSGFMSDIKVKPTGIVTLPITHFQCSYAGNIFHCRWSRVTKRASEAMGLIKQVHNIQFCVKLFTNLECVRNIRKISRAFVSQVDLMTFNDDMVTPPTQSVHMVPISKCTEHKIVLMNTKLPVLLKAQMVHLNGLATSWLVIRKTIKLFWSQTLRSSTSSTQPCCRGSAAPTVRQMSIYFNWHEGFVLTR